MSSPQREVFFYIWKFDHSRNELFSSLHETLNSLRINFFSSKTSFFLKPISTFSVSTAFASFTKLKINSKFFILCRRTETFEFIHHERIMIVKNAKNLLISSHLIFLHLIFFNCWLDCSYGDLLVKLFVHFGIFDQKTMGYVPCFGIPLGPIFP